MYKVVVPNEIDKDMQFMAFIQKLNSKDYLICDVKGEILALGKQMADLFNLNPSFLENNSVNIQLLAPGLLSYFKGNFLDYLQENDNPNQQQDQDNNKLLKKTFYLQIDENLKEFIIDVNIQDKIIKKKEKDIDLSNQDYVSILANEKNPQIKDALYQEWIYYLKVIKQQYDKLTVKLGQMSLFKVKSQLIKQSYFNNKLELIVIKITNQQDKSFNNLYLQNYITKQKVFIKKFTKSLMSIILKTQPINKVKTVQNQLYADLKAQKQVEMIYQDKNELNQFNYKKNIQTKQEIYEKGIDKQHVQSFIDQYQPMTFEQQVEYMSPRGRKNSERSKTQYSEADNKLMYQKQFKGISIFTIIRIRYQMKKYITLARNKVLLDSQIKKIRSIKSLKQIKSLRQINKQNISKEMQQLKYIELKESDYDETDKLLSFEEIDNSKKIESIAQSNSRPHKEMNKTSNSSLSPEQIKDKLRRLPIQKRLILGSICLIAYLLLIMTMLMINYMYIETNHLQLQKTAREVQTASQYSTLLSILYQYTYLNQLYTSNKLDPLIFTQSFMNSQQQLAQDSLKTLQSIVNQNMKYKSSEDNLFQSNLQSYLLHEYIYTTDNQTITITYQDYLHLILQTSHFNLQPQPQSDQLSLQSKTDIHLQSTTYNITYLTSLLSTISTSIHHYKTIIDNVLRLTYLLLMGLLAPIIIKEKQQLNHTLSLFRSVSIRDVSFYQSHYTSLVTRLSKPNLPPDLFNKLDQKYNKRLEELNNQQQSGQVSHQLGQIYIQAFNYNHWYICLWIVIAWLLGVAVTFLAASQTRQFNLNLQYLSTQITIYNQIGSQSVSLMTEYLKVYNQDWQPSSTNTLQQRLPILQSMTNALQNSPQVFALLQDNSNSNSTFIQLFLSQDICTLLNKHCPLNHKVHVINYLIDQAITIQQSLTTKQHNLSLLPNQQSIVQALDLMNDNLLLSLESSVSRQTTLERQISWIVMITWITLVLPWYTYQSYWLSTTSKTINGFILLIPTRLIQENQFLKIWLKQKIGIKQTYDQ